MSRGDVSPARLVAPRLDPMFEIAKARRMVLSDLALDIDGAQFDLVALRLAQARRSSVRCIKERCIGWIKGRNGWIEGSTDWRPGVLGEVCKKFVAGHHRLLRIK